MQHLAVDPDEPSPPATSPIATAAPSQRPCIRTRGAKGGKGGKAKQTSRFQHVLKGHIEGTIRHVAT